LRVGLPQEKFPPRGYAGYGERSQKKKVDSNEEYIISLLL